MPGFDGWDKDEQGRLKLWPFLGFATAVFAGERGGLRLEFGQPPAKPGQPVAAVQVAFGEQELRALSDALADVADRLAASKKESGHA